MNAHGPSATYTVTGVNGGTCNISFTDASSQQQIVAVTVTASGFIINKNKKK